MNRKFSGAFLTGLISLSLVAPGCSGAGNVNSDSSDSIDIQAAADTFTTLEYADLKVEQAVTRLGDSKILIQSPLNGNQQFVDSVRLWENSVLAESYGCLAFSGDLNNLKDLVQYYKSKMTFTEGDKYDDQIDEIIVIDRNETITTIGHNQIMFIGGAHGYEANLGTTFLNSTGEIFGWDDLQVSSDVFADRLAKGVMEYFGAEKLDELNQLLILDDEIVSSKDIPLPKKAPWIQNDSIVLYYETYEIGPNSAGHPTVKLPLGKSADILTEKGKAFLKQ